MIPKLRQRNQRQKKLCLGDSTQSITEVFLYKYHDDPKQTNRPTYRNREACDFGSDRALVDRDFPSKRLGSVGFARKKLVAAGRCLPDGSFGALDQLLALACFGQCARGNVRARQSSPVGVLGNTS